MFGLWPASGWVLAAALLVACAPKQMIPLDVSPQPVSLYVDGEELEETPDSLELHADRDHTLFFKREGYRSQMVVLRTEKVDDKDRLVPADVKLVLQADIDTTPRLKVEME